MPDHILLGRGKDIVQAPEALWKQQLAAVPQHGHSRLSFMTEAHHRVRNLAVTELMRTGSPLDPETIASRLEMPPEQVADTLDELERKLFFLVRNAQGAVAWAYPVTVEPTPHRLTFNTGERLFGA